MNYDTDEYRFQQVYCDSHVPVEYIQYGHSRKPTEIQKRDADFKHTMLSSDSDMIANEISNNAVLPIKVRLHNRKL